MEGQTEDGAPFGVGVDKEPTLIFSAKDESTQISAGSGGIGILTAPSSSFPDSQRVIDAALSNVVILDSIFSFLPSRKGLRLLCHSWNDAILSGKSIPTLKLHPILFGSSGTEPLSTSTFQTRIDSLDPRLVKCCRLENRSRYEDDVHPKLLHFCEKLGSNIHRFMILWSVEVVPTLFQILANNSTPNIKSLSIIIQTNSRVPIPPPPRVALEPILPLPLPAKLALRTIFFSCWDRPYTEANRDSIYATVSPFLHSLLRAAPKLRTLVVESFFCPCLESNTEIKVFRFYSYLHKEKGGYGNSILNLGNLTQILGKLKDSLEILGLKSFQNKRSDNLIHVEIPEMPKLVEFHNGGIIRSEGIHLNLGRGDLLRDKMPSLVKLSLSFGPIEDPAAGINFLEDILHLSHSHSGVRSLSLSLVNEDSTEALAGLRYAFPSLQSLDLMLHTQLAVKDATSYGEWVGHVLVCCSTLGLIHLGVRTGKNYALSPMAELLWECQAQLFEKLKTLEIINLHGKYPPSGGGVTEHVPFTGRSKFEKVLIRMKGMKGVVLGGFGLEPQHWEEIRSFVSHHKLPVQLLHTE